MDGLELKARACLWLDSKQSSPLASSGYPSGPNNGSEMTGGILDFHNFNFQY